MRSPGGSAAELLALTPVDSWSELLELLSRPVSLAILLAGFFGLLVGWLVRGKDGKVGAEVGPALEDSEELRWRHEKLVLTERQQVEKQARLDAFAEEVSRRGAVGAPILSLKCFVLAERTREARQRVGSDLSRMIAVRDRLGRLGEAEERAHDAVRACVEMASSRAALLEGAREKLRGIAEETLRVVAEIDEASEVEVGKAVSWRKVLRDLKGSVLELPQGWEASDVVDRQIRDLLKPFDAAGIAAVRDVLLVDGAVTASLAGAESMDLPGAFGEVISALAAFEIPRPAAADPDCETAVCAIAASDGGGEEDEDPSIEVIEIPAAEPANPFSDAMNFGFPPMEETSVAPDSFFRDPAEFSGADLRLSKGFRDLTKGAANGKNGAHGAGLSETAGSQADLPLFGDLEGERSLVLFCSNDVELWGRDVYRGAHCRARSIREFPDWAQWISIRRLDTRERVFAPIETASLRSGQSSDPVGFNGTNELFYGARHLGIFSESCPNEVETRFTYGGWGFGHRAHEIAPEVEQLQAAGWEGREIPADTVFEIVIHEELPSLGKLDRLLEVSCGRGAL